MLEDIVMFKKGDKIMSTRATITFYEGEQKMVHLYHHWDGYVEGLGHDIASWLLTRTVVNGLGLKNPEGVCNGVGCLVAQFIRDFKTEAGNLYVEPIDSADSDMIDYHYKIVLDPKYGKADDITTISVTCWNDKEPIFVGKPSELLKFKE